MSRPSRRPPGPSDPYDPAGELLPWLAEQRSRYGDLFQASIYGRTVYVLSAPAHARHVLVTRWRNYLRKSAAITRISLSLGNGLLSSNGPLWVRQRRMLQPAFSRPSIGALLPLIVRVNEQLRARWAQAAQDGVSVDVSADVSRATLEITLRALFGEDYPSVAGEFDLIADDPRDLEFARGFSALRELVTSIARARRERGRDGEDLLGRILKARDRDSGEPMSDSQLSSEVLTIAVAGHETSASILAWTWYLLATHPRVEKRLLAEIDAQVGVGPLTIESLKRLQYMHQVIEEALRLYPPAWLVTRRSLHDDHLGEFFVPAGTEIFISPFLIQRHPAFWERPEEFEPERFEGPGGEGSRAAALCPFGSGPRNCIGEFMARLEIQAQLVTVLRKVRLSSCGERPQICADINLSTREHLHLRPYLRAATRERVAEASFS